MNRRRFFGLFAAAAARPKLLLAPLPTTAKIGAYVDYCGASKLQDCASAYDPSTMIGSWVTYNATFRAKTLPFLREVSSNPTIIKQLAEQGYDVNVEAINELIAEAQS